MNDLDDLPRYEPIKHSKDERREAIKYRRHKRDRCVRKWGYNYKDAVGTAKKQMRENPGLRLYIYKCPLCRKYHLTHQTPRRKV